MFVGTSSPDVVSKVLISMIIKTVEMKLNNVFIDAQRKCLLVAVQTVHSYTVIGITGNG